MVSAGSIKPVRFQFIVGFIQRHTTKSLSKSRTRLCCSWFLFVSESLQRILIVVVHRSLSDYWFRALLAAAAEIVILDSFLGCPCLSVLLVAAAWSIVIVISSASRCEHVSLLMLCFCVAAPALFLCCCSCPVSLLLVCVAAPALFLCSCPVSLLLLLPCFSASVLLPCFSAPALFLYCCHHYFFSTIA